MNKTYSRVYMNRDRLRNWSLKKYYEKQNFRYQLLRMITMKKYFTIRKTSCRSKGQQNFRYQKKKSYVKIFLQWRSLKQ